MIRPGDYLTGIVIVIAYLGSLISAAPYAFGESLVKDRVELGVYGVTAMLSGLLIGHKWFGQGRQ